MGNLDLDQAKAARAEALGEPHTITFGGEEFKLPEEVPLEFSNLLIAGDLGGALRTLFADQADRFFSHRPSVNDTEVLVSGVTKLYGFDEPGESRASNDSLTNISDRLRPTSPASTKKTSRSSAGAKTG